MDIKRLVWAGEIQDIVRVDRYPDLEVEFKTVMLTGAAFDGTVIIEGSIALDPQEDDWYECIREDFERPAIGYNQSQNRVWTLRSAVVWMRAKIIETPQPPTVRYGGRIDRITVM